MIRRPPRLRRRLAMVVVAAAILGAGLAWWLAAGIARSQMIEAQQRNRALVEVVAGKVGLYLRHPAENLAAVANGLEQGTIPQAGILYELEHLRQYTRVFSQLMFLDAAGVVVAASPAGSYSGLDLSRHPAFLAARTAAGLQWGDISRSIDTGAPVVTISLRCPSGVLIGTFDLGRLGDIPTSIDLGTGGFVAILDRNGASIAHSDPDVALQGWSFASLKPAAQGQAMGKPTRWQGRDGIAIAVPVPDCGWSVVAFQSSEAIFAKARQLRWTMTAAIAGTVMVMAWLVYLLAVRLLQPLGSLVQAAGTLAAGGSADVPTPYDELSGAVTALNDLAAGVRQREEDICRSRQEFADLVENVDSIILRLTPDARIAFMNTSAERVFGYSRSEAIGQPVVGLIMPTHDSQGNDLRVWVDRYLADPAAFAVHEIENITKSGDLIWVSWRNRVSRDAQGQLTGIFSVGHDITERKRVEEEQKCLEDRARRQSSAITTLVLDASIMTAELHAAISQVAKITALSMEVARAGIWMLSEDESELRCLSMYELGPDQHSQDMVLSTKEFPGYFKALLEESRISANDAQNDPRTSEMSPGYLAPLGITSMLDAGIQSEGKLVGVLCLEHIGSSRLWKADEEAFSSTMAAIVAQIMANDRRKKAEWAQGESEELQRSLLQTIPDLILRTDIEGKIIFINEVGFPGIDSIDRGSLCGKSIFSFVPEQDRPKAMEKARQRLEKDIGPQEYRLQFEDGTQVDAELNGAVVRDRDEKAIGMVYVVRNISDRKSAEKEKEDLQSQLVQAQKMEAVGRLAGGVAHDFNNMLGAILGYAELALNKMDLSDPLSNYLQQILKAAERSADLTRQLLAFARKQNVAPKVLDLNQTIEGMVNMLTRLIGEDIDVAWLPGRNLGAIKMDPSQIDQILVNLCVNARDAIGDTGKVTIETNTSAFDAYYCAKHADFVPGEYVLLAVSDNGCGMDKKTMDNLFEPFFTTKEQGKGTGLGLASVYGAVKQNNGFINVYSEPGLGTTFKIYLPRHVDKAVQAKEERLLQSAERGSETILLVEDEPMILELTTTMLEQLGYTVLAAPVPGEAIRLAGEHTDHIDLLMTDVIMPEMNGRDLAQNLLSIYPDIRRLFMSGYTANVIAHHGVLDEGVHFIQKPFTINDLSVKIREVLDFRNDQ